MAIKLSEAAEKRVEELKAKYPDSRSAVMPALYIAQEELGYVNGDAINWVAEKIGMAPVHVMEVATFYTMYYKKPVGKYHFQVCRTLSCALRGAREITEHLHKRFNLLPGEVSADGKWSYEEVECLGSCGTAPMCEVNDIFFENLTPEKLEAIIERIDKENPDLRFSSVKDKLGEGLKGQTKSEII
ncbi:MAG: NAD(P)H-dependent oxidoreductase subunit E [Deltaproteobacteria bacterium]|nr:NAD(P)H-dependent oxidoreductase subunit E [Deltaproteobacteria bacterium]